MSYLRINDERITPESAERLVKICPFSAITYESGKLDINSACKLCKICVNRGPQGALSFVEDESSAIDKSAWRGIAVYVEHHKGEVHPVTLELIGKARELAEVTGHPVYALMLGSGIIPGANSLLKFGVNKVFVYDYEQLDEFFIDLYSNAFEDFIRKTKPSSILVGATNIGRSLAPRVAARFRTGLTADCTMLEMKENTDLVQIRPAFGGNIMARIVTPNHRPQFCTVRYKIFSAPSLVDTPSGEIVRMELPREKLMSDFTILEQVVKPREIDISEAEVIVAAGRGIKTQQDLVLVREFADLLGAQTACTRPLIEAGWFDPRRQIGLSGRTVKPKLIITCGISGSVQFGAGMRGSECIVAINKDKNAPIFEIAHYGIVGDLYEIIPILIEKIKGGRSNVSEIV